MSRISNLIIVLPCEGLDDFPTHFHDPQAASLHACWTGLWHPLLIQATQSLPAIQSAQNTEPVWNSIGSNQPSSRPLLVVPALGSEPLCSEMLASWSVDCDPVVIEQPVDRSSIFQQVAKADVELVDANEGVSTERILDFYALGYAYLQVQLMTRKLRFSSNLNETEFLRQVTAAADAVAAGEDESCQQKLTACFDLLLTEKNNYYPVQPQLCELLLLHDTTLGTKLTAELAQDEPPISLMLTGNVANQLTDKNPAAVQTIKQRLQRRNLCLLGGLSNESVNELVAGDTWVNQLQAGKQTFTEIFGAQPSVFAKRKSGLNPTSPNILEKSGFAGVVHANFSSGKIPDMGNGIMRWTGDDDQYILAVSEKPMLATDHGTFIRLSTRLGEMIDSVHEATALLTRWPGQQCEALEDLKRLSSFAPLLGEFTSLEQVFDDAYDPGYGQTFNADDYCWPYLDDALAAGQSDPISRHARYWRRHYQLESVRRVLLLATCCQNLDAQNVEQLQQAVQTTQSQIEHVLDADSAIDETLDATLDRLHQQAIDLFSLSTLATTSSTGTESQPVKPTSTPGQVAASHALLLNGRNTTGRYKVHSTSASALRPGTDRDKAPVLLAVNSDSNATWIVELPAFSQTPVDWNQVQSNDQLSRDPQLADELELQNEFFRVLIDSKTGGIKSVRKQLSRENLVGQQLAIRLPAGHRSRQRYASMQADNVQTIENDPLTAAIESQGRIVAGGQDLAQFSQAVRLSRAINRIEISGQIKLLEPLAAASKSHYLCSRLAWKSETARLFANLLDSPVQITRDWFHGTQFVSIRDQSSVTMLTGGLPFHCRANRRMLDSVLMIGNESQTNYSLALAIDEAYPVAAAAARLGFQTAIPIDPGSQHVRQWYFHFNRKNILVTHARPLFDSQGAHHGAAFRLKETETRATELSVQSWRRIKSADIVGFDDQLISTIDIAPDDRHKIQLRVEPLSYFEIRLYF